jgi:predicted dehydrogenase
MSIVTRRDFLRGTAGLAALAAAGLPGRTGRAAPAQPQANNVPRGPNERLRMACIGVRGQGMSHVRGYAGRHNCIVTHVCDVDLSAEVVGRAVQEARQRQGSEPRVVQDLRRIMDDPSIDAVSIATPNHWHALAAIWAIQAGKDVYVEKPVSHNVSEGRRIVEFARRHNRICQTGTQIRSQPGIRQAMEFLHSGQLGRVLVARGLCYKRRDTIGRVGPAGGAVPSSIDYDLWCGPAPRQQPLRRERLHYDWHWVWDTGNGDLGNQGIHQMDVARWGLGKAELARSALSVGGRFGYVDDGQTANTQVCAFDYGDAALIFEVRGLPTRDFRGAMVGNVFHCSDGYLVCTSYTDAAAYRPDGERVRTFSGGGDHFGNFIAAVRSRRREDLHADIQEGHLSSALCHLANISFRLGTVVPMDRGAEVFPSPSAAAETLEATVEHLGTTTVNGVHVVPLSDTNLQVGRRLTVNPQTERFIDDAEADTYLTRRYRPGFEVPARV